MAKQKQKQRGRGGRWIGYIKCGVNYPRKPIKSTELKNKKEGGENLFKSTQYCKIRTNGNL